MTAFGHQQARRRSGARRMERTVKQGRSQGVGYRVGELDILREDGRGLWERRICRQALDLANTFSDSASFSF